MNQLETYLANTYSKVICICGPAGSGKSTFTKKYPTTYELDSCFVGDSDFRKQLLKNKSKDFVSYIDACSMLGWNNWEKAYADIERLTEMVTGIANMDSFHGKFVVVNGAICGPGYILALFDELIYVHVPQHVRWSRLVERDGHKRSLKELMARFLITENAEAKYYRAIFNQYKNKIKVVDKDFNFVSNFDLNVFDENNYCPFPV